MDACFDDDRGRNGFQYRHPSHLRDSGKGENMLIRVVYNDNKYDFIKPARLNEMLKAGAISMFQRSSGWVRVGIDPLRINLSAPRDKANERRHS